MFRNLPRITRIREIFNDTTNARMEELEQRLKEIQIKLELNCLEERQKLTKDSIIEYLTNPLHQTSKRLLRTLIEKILVYDDKIEIFYKYTKKTPENPRESLSYPSSDSSVLVDLRRILRANRAIFPFPALCAALVPKLRFGVNCGMASPYLRSHLTGPQKGGGDWLGQSPPPFWWTCAELNCGLTRFVCGHYTLSL